MTIGFDLRPLQDPVGGGVAEYTLNLIEALLKVDTQHEYIFFTTGWQYGSRLRSNSKNILRASRASREVHLRYPNKILNFCMRVFGWPHLDAMVESRIGKKIDLIIFPNINFISVTPGCPYVLVVHDLSFEHFPEFFSLKRRLWHKAINPRKLVQGAYHVIAVSENTGRDIIDIYDVSEDKVRVVYPGINSPPTNGVNIHNKYNLPQSYFLYLGTLEPRKNVEGIIQAFEMLDQKIEIDLVIAGRPGWLYEGIYRTVAQSPVGSRIHCIGPIAEEDKAALYTGAVCFVYPSFYEGFGFPPLEAASYGVPVIASASSSLPEVIGDAALLVDPTNVGDLAYAMERVITDATLRDELTAKGRIVAARFSWERCAREVLDKIINTCIIGSNKEK